MSGMRTRIIWFLYKTGLVRPAFLALTLLRGLRPQSLVRSLRFILKGSSDGLPIPPFWLRAQVAGTIDAGDFYRRGVKDVETISAILQRRGIDIHDLVAVLDFGCGCGRVTRHLQSRTRAELFGTDQSAKLITWCRSNLPFATFGINRLEPPLDYADGKFDFIYALSVFTHLPARLQAMWMDEFHRVLRGGGHLLLSTHGEHQLHGLLDREKAMFRDGQLVVKRPGSAGSNYCVSYHPETYVRDYLAKGFKVVDFIPQGATGTAHQDLYLLELERRLPRSASVAAESTSIDSGAITTP